jgi:hypothetical protein
MKEGGGGRKRNVAAVFGTTAHGSGGGRPPCWRESGEPSSCFRERAASMPLFIWIHFGKRAKNWPDKHIVENTNRPTRACIRCLQLSKHDEQPCRD